MSANNECFVLPICIQKTVKVRNGTSTDFKSTSMAWVIIIRSAKDVFWVYQDGPFEARGERARATLQYVLKAVEQNLDCCNSSKWRCIQMTFLKYMNHPIVQAIVSNCPNKLEHPWQGNAPEEHYKRELLYDDEKITLCGHLTSIVVTHRQTLVKRVSISGKMTDVSCITFLTNFRSVV